MLSKSRLRAVSLIARSACAACCFVFVTPLVTAQQTARVTYHASNYPIGFLEYLPPDYNTGENFPLLIYLHGGGEVGNGTPESLERVKAWGPPSLIAKGHNMCFVVDGNKQCFVVLSPQLYPNVWTWDYTVSQILDHVFNGPSRYKIDRDRIYLTGLSRGGLGVYKFASSVFNAPNKLAAIAPIAAWVEDDNGCAIAARNIPVWAFHGQLDTVIPYGWGLSAYNGVRFCEDSRSDTEMIFTTYSDRYHDSWIPAYDTTNNYHTPNLYQWLLTKKRATPVTAIGETDADDVLIYPNPATDRISIILPENTAHHVDVLTMDGGKDILRAEGGDDIDISGLRSGVYVIKVSDDRGVVAIRRLIKLP